ncbi:MAG: heavy metal-binding domain-containing protein, partial [Candidatus Aenigmarchaeota archaeon]|nr:heavy metal-binding domain-containing protein [Candidatus Aenigmarchaeota archaeon]
NGIYKQFLPLILCLYVSLRSLDIKADAIIGVRFTTSMVMAGASEMLAYGTAVKIN